MQSWMQNGTNTAQLYRTGQHKIYLKKYQPLNSVVLRLASKPISLRIRLERFRYIDWNHGRRNGGQGGPWPHLDFEIISKKGCFSIL